jgi:hypothetical protein
VAGNERGRPSTTRTGTPQTHLPLSVHEQAEYENAVSYAQGYRDGFAAAEQAIAAEIAAAVGVKPYSARSVIRWLVAGVGRVPEPYSSPENGTTLGVAERDVLGRWAA